MTLPPRTIVVGVDYTDASIVALDQALTLGTGSPRRLVPLLALPGGATQSPASAARSAEALVNRSRQNLLGLVQARVAALPGVSEPESVEAVVTYGPPAEALSETARELGASLIVVGTRGRRGLQKLLLGSVAERVASEAECSVLIARSTRAPDEASSPEPSADDATEENFDEAPSSAPQVDEAEASAREAEVIGQPHLEGGRVVVVVLDGPTQRTFKCYFEQFGTVTVGALEGQWGARASHEGRARAARTALALSRSEPAAFKQLFGELARRKSR